MSRLPINDEARARLRAAQLEEAKALHAVQSAEAACAKARITLDAAETTLVQAQAALVRISGAHRAALLLDVTAERLQRIAKGARTLGSAGGAATRALSPRPPDAPATTAATPDQS
jgi:precorrin-6B methylase 1